MKYQSAHFNTLAPRLTLRLRIHKRRMRDPARPTIRLGIETLDQRHQIRRLCIAVVPLNPRIGLHAQGLPLAVRVDQLDRNEVRLRDGVGVCHGERVLEDGADRAPDVHNLVPVLQKLGRVVGEVVADAVGSCWVGLVDVDALDGAAEGILGAGVAGRAADGVVEDEDA